MDETTAAQLALIEELTALLSAAAVPHWLFGGWAVDFLVGAVTRRHADVEFVVWRYDLDRIAPLLAAHGYRSVPAAADEVVAFDKRGHAVQFCVIERRADGGISTPGRFADWSWLPGSLSAPPGRLGALVCPVISAESQLESKEHFSLHPAGGPLRAKDRADIARLRAFLATRG
jgi:hypothetical protein